MSKTQRNERKEYNEKALGEDFGALGKKIAEKEGIDVSGKEMRQLDPGIGDRTVADSHLGLVSSQSIMEKLTSK